MSNQIIIDQNKEIQILNQRIESLRNTSERQSAMLAMALVEKNQANEKLIKDRNSEYSVIKELEQKNDALTEQVTELQRRLNSIRTTLVDYDKAEFNLTQLVKYAKNYKEKE